MLKLQEAQKINKTICNVCQCDTAKKNTKGSEKKLRNVSFTLFILIN